MKNSFFFSFLLFFASFLFVGCAASAPTPTPVVTPTPTATPAPLDSAKIFKETRDIEQKIGAAGALIRFHVVYGTKRWQLETLVNPSEFFPGGEQMIDVFDFSFNTKGEIEFKRGTNFVPKKEGVAGLHFKLRNPKMWIFELNFKSSSDPKQKDVSFGEDASIPGIEEVSRAKASPTLLLPKGAKRGQIQLVRTRYPDEGGSELCVYVITPLKGGAITQEVLLEPDSAK